MAFRAGPGVVDWPESLVDSIFLFKNSLCSAKGGIVHQTVALTLAAGILAECRCVESGGRFCWPLVYAKRRRCRSEAHRRNGGEDEHRSLWPVHGSPCVR